MSDPQSENICPVCKRRPCVVKGYFGDFCSKGCRDWYENAAFLCYRLEVAERKIELGRERRMMPTLH